MSFYNGNGNNDGRKGAYYDPRYDKERRKTSEFGNGGTEGYGAESERESQGQKERRTNAFEQNGARGGYDASDIGRLAAMPKDELMNELFRNAAALKGTGNFNAEELEDFYNKSSAFLSPEQLRRMRSIIDMLK